MPARGAGDSVSEIRDCRPLRGLGSFQITVLGLRYAPPQALCFRLLRRLVGLAEQMDAIKRDKVTGSRPVAAFLFLLVTCSSVVTRPIVPSVSQTSQALAATQKLTRADEQFLEDLERRSFQYFWAEADSQTGLVPDRARMDGAPLDPNHQNVASIAATGFGLTGLCIA